jgi:hypothetical protein
VADFQFMTAPVIVGTIVALLDSIGCRIVVDGVVNPETIAREEKAVTFTSLLAA